jgi:predicted DNA-binding protein
MPSKKTKVVGVRFSNEEVAKIEAIARQQGGTYTTVVREIVGAYLQKVG